MAAFGGTAPPRAGPAAGLSGCASPPGPTCRSLCTAAEQNLSYQELKELKKARVLHIDVRERWEIERFGKIPESTNIPRKLSTPQCAGVGCSMFLLAGMAKWWWLSKEEWCRKAAGM